MIYSINSHFWWVLYSYIKLRHLEQSENIYYMKISRYLLIYSNICLDNKNYIPFSFKKADVA